MQRRGRASSRCSAARQSAACPGVSRKASGRPWRSVTAWTLVLRPPRLLAGVAGLVAGAMSMAAGECVRSVHRLTPSPRIFRVSAMNWPLGLSLRCASYHQSIKVAGWTRQLPTRWRHNSPQKDAIGAHARDELSIPHITTSRPVQAALTSAATFTAGAALPLMVTWLSPFGPLMIISVSVASLLFLALLGRRARKQGEPRSARQLCAWLFGAH